MERVLVLGCSGAGKSTLARLLGERLGLPVIHLDAEYWRPGWVETEEAAWHARMAELVQRERWVIDGNFSGTLGARLPRADTIIFLDFPTALCMTRVLLRWLRYRGETRPDMGPGCPEKVDLEFLRWIWGFRRRSRPKVVAELATLKPSQRLVVLRAPVEVERFLAGLEVRGRG